MKIFSGISLAAQCLFTLWVWAELIYRIGLFYSQCGGEINTNHVADPYLVQKTVDAMYGMTLGIISIVTSGQSKALRWAALINLILLVLAIALVWLLKTLGVIVTYSDFVSHGV